MQSDTIRLRELRIRYAVRTDADGRPVALGRTLRRPQEVAHLLTTLLQDEATEVFGLLCLTTTHRVIAYHEVSRGGLDATLVHPRDVFKAAILANAAAVILAHTHPSGDPTPSGEDTALTRRLVDGGALLGIEVLDHLIVGDGRYCSFREEGRL